MLLLSIPNCLQHAVHLRLSVNLAQYSTAVSIGIFRIFPMKVAEQSVDLAVHPKFYAQPSFTDLSLICW